MGRPGGSDLLPPVPGVSVGDVCPGGLAAMQVQWGVAPGAPVQGLIGIAVARARSGGSVMSTDVRFFVGIDWASETHQVCLVAADGKIVGERAFAHGGAGLAEMCDWLVTTSGEEPPKIAVAIEVPHGPIVEILLERRFQVDAVNPKQLDRFRDRFTVAGAKDDRRDAYVLADALRTDRHCFRRLGVEDPVVIELREWSRMAEDLQQERNRVFDPEPAEAMPVGTQGVGEHVGIAANV